MKASSTKSAAGFASDPECVVDRSKALQSRPEDNPMRKRVILAAGTMAGLVGSALLVLAMLPRPGVTKANFDRIEDGMTRAEVQGFFRDQPHQVRSGGDLCACTWQGDDGSIALVVFRDDRAVEMRWGESTETILDKIRRWLRL